MTLDYRPPEVQPQYRTERASGDRSPVQPLNSDIAAPASTPPPTQATGQATRLNWRLVASLIGGWLAFWIVLSVVAEDRCRYGSCATLYVVAPAVTIATLVSLFVFATLALASRFRRRN